MRKRILTGDRTTGKLHLGHYVGSLKNRVELQENYETFIILADVQALTTHFEHPEKVKEGIYDVAIDNLAVGLDPERVRIFQQSQVKAIAELTVFYSMIVSVNSLRHNPTIKTEARQYGYKDLSYGFLGYPVSQAADITFLNADLVPVGDDQLPHMEQTRKIVRRFNHLYGNGCGPIKVPEALLSSTPRLPGLDGNSKMGKSLGNAVYLSDDQEMVLQKIMAAKTDTGRVRLRDKGHPEECTVAYYHKTFNKANYQNICEMCRNATIGCRSCKEHLAEEVNGLLDPIRERRRFYSEHPDYVKEIIQSGTGTANSIGNIFIEEIKEAMSIKLM